MSFSRRVRVTRRVYEHRTRFLLRVDPGEAWDRYLLSSYTRATLLRFETGAPGAQREVSSLCAKIYLPLYPLR